MSEKTVEDILNEFKKLPDWKNYPLPEVLYTKYGFPRPAPNNNLQESLWTQLSPPPHEFLGLEIRDKAPGGVREIKPLEDLPVSIELLTNQTDDEHQQEKPQSSDDSKESNETKTQETTLHF